MFRQAEQSAIIRAAHAVDRGELPPLENSGSGDLFFLRRRAPDRLVPVSYTHLDVYKRQP